MKIPSIVGNNYNISHCAKFNLNSTGFVEYTRYLDMCKDAPKGYFNTSANIKIFDKICKAIEAHPSSAIISADIFYRQGELFNARGVLQSSYGKIVDVEPSRSDDGTAPIENVLRKVLDPVNKKIFNKLVGSEYKDSYVSWWEQNIKPIWNQIKEVYAFDGDILPEVTQTQYNKNFRKQIDIVKGNVLFG